MYAYRGDASKEKVSVAEMLKTAKSNFKLEHVRKKMLKMVSTDV